MKVLVVGLLPQQAGLIQTEFGDVFELDFFKEGRPHILSTAVAMSDCTVLMTSKVSHWMSDTVKRSVRVLYCNGGMSQLRDTLTTLYLEAHPAEGK